MYVCIGLSKKCRIYIILLIHKFHFVLGISCLYILYNYLLTNHIHHNSHCKSNKFSYSNHRKCDLDKLNLSHSYFHIKYNLSNNLNSKKLFPSKIYILYCISHIIYLKSLKCNLLDILISNNWLMPSNNKKNYKIIRNTHPQFYNWLL